MEERHELCTTQTARQYCVQYEVDQTFTCTKNLPALHRKTAGISDESATDEEFRWRN